MVLLKYKRPRTVDIITFADHGIKTNLEDEQGPHESQDISPNPI